ncbi:MAG: galactokinase [Eggerthellaceae bacterium]|nr:galactokinase [Eggerthellaceae bacterium]
MSAVRAFAPGRTELAGNHTDHQGGRVVAAAVDCGVEIVLARRASSVARLESEGFAPVEIDVGDLAARADERNTTAALVRGVIAGLGAAGVDPFGFEASAKSTVPGGSGLSSSAAFELALASALLAQAGVVLGPVQLARIGQAAERDYFGKPCGLMDQLAVALGGVAAIDFSNEDEPAVERISFDLESMGYALCLIDTHCDHSLYTDEYAQVALDMFAVARFFGAGRLCQVPESAFFDRLEDVRSALGDVPALRALHYYQENKLVDKRAEALRSGDFPAFLEYARRSAASSAAYLQNVSTADRKSQPAMVVLALADALLEGEGAVRIHGGGFGGTVQAFVPRDRLGHFTRCIDGHLGEGSCKAYGIFGKGAQAQCL